MFLNVLNFILIALQVVLIFNLIIIVHELGHFLAARWRGLVVEEFGVWFGKPLWKKKINGVWYSLGSVPAGGFVKLPQMAPMETLEGDSEINKEAMPPVRPLDKAIVAFAGPLFSMLLALALATLVWGIGKPVHEAEATRFIGYVQPGGPADKAGLKAGDEILEVDGKQVTKFGGPLNSIMWQIMRSEGETIAFKVKRGDEILNIQSGWTRESTDSWKRKSLRKVMIGPRERPYVGQVKEGSPGDQAGLKPGDVVTAVEGKPIIDLKEVFDALLKNKEKTTNLTVQRADGTSASIDLAPTKSPDGEGMEIGVFWGEIKLTYPNPVQQVVDAVHTMGNMIGALFSPKSDVKAQHFSGPVGIMKLYSQLFKLEDGWRFAIAFSVFFNVNLALLNMLPFPVLDGGHIVLAGIEGVRRRPVNTRFLEVVQTACAVALISFMLYVTFYDVGDFFGGNKTPAPTPAPQEQTTPAPKTN